MPVEGVGGDPGGGPIDPVTQKWLDFQCLVHSSGYAALKVKEQEAEALLGDPVALEAFIDQVTAEYETLQAQIQEASEKVDAANSDPFVPDYRRYVLTMERALSKGEIEIPENLARAVTESGYLMSVLQSHPSELRNLQAMTDWEALKTQAQTYSAHVVFVTETCGARDVAEQFFDFTGSTTATVTTKVGEKWDSFVHPHGVFTGSGATIENMVGAGLSGAINLADENVDFITEGSYVELVNALRAIEDMIDPADTSVPTDTDLFWGKKGTVTVGAETFTVALSAEDRAEKKLTNVTAWENRDEFGTDYTLTGTNEEKFNKLRILKSSLELIKRMGDSGKLSPGLNAQASFIGYMGALFTEAMGNVVPGTNLDTAMIEIEAGYDLFVNAKGYRHLKLLKSALFQHKSGVSIATVIRPSVADLAFFEYASTGEASLNRQIGALGEQMKNLNSYLESLNTLDRIFNKSTLQPDHRGYIWSSGAGQFTAQDTADVNTAIAELTRQFKIEADTSTTLGQVGQLNLSQRRAVGELLALLNLRGVSGTSALSYSGDPEADSAVVVTQDVTGVESQKANFGFGGTEFQADANADAASLTAPVVTQPNLRKVFNDEQFHTALANAITFGQGVNDDVKQKLKKVMFVYQEFIKSAGSVIEKVAQLIKSVAQKVG